MIGKTEENIGLKQIFKIEYVDRSKMVGEG